MSRVVLTFTTVTAALITACGPAPDSQQSSSEVALSRASTDSAHKSQRSSANNDSSDGRESSPGQFLGVDYFGDGCPAGSTTTGISPDGQAVTTIFSAFTVTVGPDSERGDASRGCLMQVRVAVPAGWSYRLDSVDHRGFLALDGGVSASRQSFYLPPSGRPVSGPVARWQGQLQDDFNDRNLSPDSALAWSPCGGGDSLIVTQLGLRSDDADASGLAALDSTDSVLAWRRCQ